MSGFRRLHELRMENDAAGFVMQDMRDRFEALRSRHEDGTAPRVVSAFNLFQTPVGLADRMAGLLPDHAKQIILEPSAGLGRLYSATKARFPLSAVHMVEESPDCCAELFRITEDDDTARILQRDFLAVESEAVYDAVIMNPPFKMRRDLKHVEHALLFLKPGGVLVGLCLAGPIREKALRSRCSHWETIPAGTFRSEGTGVETILFVMDA